MSGRRRQHMALGCTMTSATVASLLVATPDVAFEFDVGQLGLQALGARQGAGYLAYPPPPLPLPSLAVCAAPGFVVPPPPGPALQPFLQCPNIHKVVHDVNPNQGAAARAECEVSALISFLHDEGATPTVSLPHC